MEDLKPNIVIVRVVGVYYVRLFIFDPAQATSTTVLAIMKMAKEKTPNMYNFDYVYGRNTGMQVFRYKYQDSSRVPDNAKNTQNYGDRALSNLLSRTRHYQQVWQFYRSATTVPSNVLDQIPFKDEGMDLLELKLELPELMNLTDGYPFVRLFSENQTSAVKQNLITRREISTLFNNKLPNVYLITWRLVTVPIKSASLKLYLDDFEETKSEREALLSDSEYSN